MTLREKKKLAKKKRFNSYQRDWRKRNPEKWRKIQMKWYQKNKEKIRNKQWQKKCPPYGDNDVIRFIETGDEKKIQMIERMIKNGL